MKLWVLKKLWNQSEQGDEWLLMSGIAEQGKTHAFYLDWFWSQQCDRKRETILLGTVMGLRRMIASREVRGSIISSGERLRADSDDWPLPTGFPTDFTVGKTSLCSSELERYLRLRDNVEDMKTTRVLKHAQLRDMEKVTDVVNLCDLV
ncbi:hypothetical protein Tco_1382252 [Tanacetum coccineum]